MIVLMGIILRGNWQEISRIAPITGPAEAAGTVVTFYGRGFVNTTSLACRFGVAPPVPAQFVSPNELSCESPPLSVSSLGRRTQVQERGGLAWSALSEIRQRDIDPLSGSRLLFPGAHHYPLMLQRPVGVEVRLDHFISALFVTL